MDNKREKYWQLKTGRMAAIANWALTELLEVVATDSSENDQANVYLHEVIPLLDFDEGQE